MASLKCPKCGNEEYEKSSRILQNYYKNKSSIDNMENSRNFIFYVLGRYVLIGLN